MSLRERMRKFVIPTWQEQQEKMKRQEVQRKANFERRQAVLDHKLASLTRQESLAEKERKVRELHKKLHPQPTGPASFGSTEAIGDALNFNPSKKRRQ